MRTQNRDTRGPREKTDGAQHLIIQTAFLGDVLLGIPLFKEVKRLYPQDQIVLVCRKGVGSFFTDAGLVDEVIEVDKSSSESLKALGESLKGRQFNLLLCPHESFRSSLLARKIDARLKIGFRRFFNRFIFDHCVERPLDLPEAFRQLSLLTPVEPSWADRLITFRSMQKRKGGQAGDGSLIAPPEAASMEVPKLMEHRKAKVMREGRPIAVLAPGSVWATKKWTEAGFIEAANDLSRRGFEIILFGSKDEATLCERIASQVSGARSLAGQTTLYGSAELLAGADLLICNDSGAMHLGAAAGVPTVSVFGPTVLEFGYRPWQANARVVQTELACRPCGKHGSQKCPLGTHDCMKLVSASMVLQAASDVISSGDASAHG